VKGEVRIRTILLEESGPEAVESALRRVRETLNDENAFYGIDHLKEWIDGIRLESPVRILEKPVRSLRKWGVDPDTGSSRHDSGEFFTVMGVEVVNASREVAGWDQPMIHQKEAGILGILMIVKKGVPHYLLNAKMEPGNTLLYQISPTLQATYSNLKMAHGGRKPAFAGFFADDTPGTIRYRRWLAEDGGRFYLKSNLNLLVEVQESLVPAIPADFKWFTLSQIKAFLGWDNYINPHVRSILSHL
jgi:oxidase EvaA